MNNNLKFTKVDINKLSNELKNSLLKYINESSKIGEYKLPSEIKVAKELGVSRIALREVLKELRNDGILYSLHGKGTFINKNFTNLKFRFTPAREFLKSIQASGFDASVKLIDYKIIDADDFHTKKLDLEENSKVLRINKVFYANDNPVIFCTDIVPFKYLEGIKIKDEDVKNSTFDFLKNKAFIVVENDVVEITAVLSKEIPSSFEKYKKDLQDKPLIKMSSIYYTLTQEAIMSVKAYFDSDYIKLSQIRKQNVYDNYL